MAKTQTQIPEQNILRLKAVKTVVKILNGREYYRYNTLMKSLKEILPLFANPDFTPTELISIKKIKEGSKVFYFILDQYNESLYILRDDKEDFEKELIILMDKIEGAIKEYFANDKNIKIEKSLYGIEIKLSQPTKKKFDVIRKGTIELPILFEEKDKAKIHTTHIMGLIYSHIIKFYECLNDKVPFWIIFIFFYAPLFL